MSALPRVLVIAGHDPSGAGLDADRDALSEHALEFVGIETARTDQDDRGVRSIGARDPAIWCAEARERAGAGVASLKFGLLPGRAHVVRAAQLVVHLRRSARADLPVVLDPVLAASSGSRFLDADGVEALRGELLGLDLVVTPNLPEAAEFARVPLADLVLELGARLEVARLILGLGARAVVLKGGHGAEDPVRDLVLAAGAGPVWVTHPRTPGGKLRGSGCRFASHLAGSLGLGRPLPDAVRAAGDYVAARIAAGPAV